MKARNIGIAKQVLKRNEFVLSVLILLLCVVVGSINKKFFSVETLYETLKACVVPFVLACGVMIVFISGGLDMSFMSIAIFSAYTSSKLLSIAGYKGPILLMFLLSAVIGAVLGLVNAFFISRFSIPVFIVTLSTGVIFKGFMLQFVGNIYITPTHMPESAIRFSKYFILGGLHISVFIMIGVLILTHLIMRFTLTGRGIYALGGDATAAGRVGINIKRLNLFIYVFAGVLAAIAGTIYVANSRLADPYDLTGEELSIIAPVVLGGVGIMGGRGGVFGVALGVLLTKLLQNNLTLIGVSSDWHLLVFGAVFVIAMTAQAYKDRRSLRRAV